MKNLDGGFYAKNFSWISILFIGNIDLQFRFDGKENSVTELSKHLRNGQS